MRLAIADPPYPPFVGSGGTKSRASRWYGSGQRSATDVPADFHPNAHEWDDPTRHRRLLLQLLDEYDGFAIATTPDGIHAYGDLPAVMRIMAWVKPNAQPGAHRLMSTWEAVLLYPPAGRRNNRDGAGTVRDVLTANGPRRGFVGAKPFAWTQWVLDAMSYNDTDEIVDLFPGPGPVAAVRRPPAGIRRCGICGQDFKPSRRDARTCTNACRQVAYRLRRVGIGDPTTVTDLRSPIRNASRR